MKSSAGSDPHVDKEANLEPNLKVWNFEIQIAKL